MRFSFRKKDDAPRWVDSAGFGWTPDAPLHAEPQAAPQATPKPAPERDPLPEPPAPANTNRAPSLIGQRLGIGLMQGLGLYLLLAARDTGAWPGSDPYLFSALLLAGLFAPLVAIEGLGEIENRLLALWTGTVAAILATLGLYQHWRIQAPETPNYSLFAAAVLCALMLFIAQVLLRTVLREGTARASYRGLWRATWTLAARLLVWGIAAGIAWALIGSGNSLLNWLRPRYPALNIGVAPTLVIMPLLGLASALALQLTARESWLLRQVRAALLACCTLALPVLAVAAAIALVAHLFVAPLPLALALGFALALLITFNASYRGEAKRSGWRRASEFASAFLIAALVAVAAMALAERITAYGWTGLRVLALAAIVTLGLYGIAYAGAGLIAIGGGGWMQRVETPNRILALAVIAACLALASPLADPVRLAVTAQVARAQTGDPAAFDYAWLRRKGLRFGNDALMALTHAANPQVARDAAITLSVAPGMEAPTPTEIGANITVRTPGARLPAGLLTPDWSRAVARVPPCLTKPALSCDAWLLDMDRDGRNEVLLVYGTDARWWAAVMKQGPEGNWMAAATLASPPCRGSLDAMRAGHVTTTDPLPGWRDLLVSGMRLTPVPERGSYQTCLN